MKKLKIFLLLSILLCFGFALSSEVHAQGGGPKIFEVNDVLPATSHLRISWTQMVGTPVDFIISTEYDEEFIYYLINPDDPFFNQIIINNVGIYEEDHFITPYTDFDGAHAYIDIDTSSWSLDRRTISSVGEAGYFVWEDLNASSGFSITFEENGGTSVTDLTEQTNLPSPLPIPTKENHTFVGWYYDSDFFNEDKAFAGDPLTNDVTLYARWLPGKLFEEDEVLPATTELKIRILFGQGDYFVETVDRSGIYLSIDWIGGVKDLYIEFGGLVKYDGETSASEIDYTIDISNWSLDQRTIKSVSSGNGTFVTWEDTTPDGYTQGYLAAREEYGYYDSRTNQWLSVEEYLDLYGTDKPGQSDFYANFDKYFIPAMIIVFGGAIVLTILKVFKGRE